MMISVILSACSSYDYAKKGFVVENDQFYHNAADQISFDFENEVTESGKDSKYGLRLNSIFPSDRKVLRKLGISTKDVDLYFSYYSKDTVDYHMILFKSKDSILNKSGLIPQYHAKGKHFYKQIESSHFIVHYTIIPSGSTDLGLVYYQSKDLKSTKFESVLNNSLAIGKSNFFPDKTFIECKNLVGNISVELPKKYILEHDYSLIKIYSIESHNQKELKLFTLRSPGEAPYVIFKACEGAYEVQYTDLDHQIIWKDTMTVVGEP